MYGKAAAIRANMPYACSGSEVDTKAGADDRRDISRKTGDAPRRLPDKGKRVFAHVDIVVGG
jgi:hypothetical protein